MTNGSLRRRGLSLMALAIGAALLMPAVAIAQEEIVPDESVSGEVTVGMVGNPQMMELQNLLPDFNARYPNIKVNLLILPENEIRAKVTTDVSTGAGTFDVVTVGMYEVPQWAKARLDRRGRHDARRRPRVRQRRLLPVDPRRPELRRQAVRRPVLRRELVRCSTARTSSRRPG